MATASKALNPEIHAWLEAEGLNASQAEISELTVTTEVARPTEIELRVVTDEPFAVDPGKLLGQNARLHLEWEGSRARRRFARVYAVDRMMDVRNHTYIYRVRLSSRLKGLDYRARLSIHADVSVPDAIRATLARAGLAEGVDYKMRLRATYPAREFIIQYQETDLAFVTRLCEHWGLSFFFEQGEDRDIAVFSDANVFWGRAEAGICFGVSGHRHEIFDFRAEARLGPRRFVLRDYNYRYPRVGLQSVIEFEDGIDGEVVEYGANFRDEREAELLTIVRRDDILGRRELYHGVAAQPLLESGMVFTLSNHQLHEDEDFVVYRCVERLTQPTFMSGPQDRATFTASFDASTAAVDFRPARRVPRPRIDGVLHGVVEPREGQEYGQVDEQGCYRVRLLIDDPLDKGGRPYPVVRLSQPSGGQGYGFHFPLRPGTEVMLAFIEGDPDRPIITGMAPNPNDRTPVATQNNARNVIRTESGNEINFDDTKDGTRIKLDTPFMETSFQLGSPNGPEEGIWAQSNGSISSVATTVNGVVSPLQSAWSTMESKLTFVKTTKAKRPKPWTALERASLVYNVVKGMATGLWEAGTAIHKQVFSWYKVFQTDTDERIKKLRDSLFDGDESRYAVTRAKLAAYLEAKGNASLARQLLDKGETYVTLCGKDDVELTEGQKAFKAAVEAACTEDPEKALLAFQRALIAFREATDAHTKACAERAAAIQKTGEDGQEEADKARAKADEKIKKADSRAKLTALQEKARALKAAIDAETRVGQTFKAHRAAGTAAMAAVQTMVFGGDGKESCEDYLQRIEDQCKAKQDWADAQASTDPRTLGRKALGDDGFRRAGQVVDSVSALEKAHGTYEKLKKAKKTYANMSELKTLYAGGQFTGDWACLNMGHSVAWLTLKGFDTSATPPIPLAPSKPAPRAFQPAHGASDAKQGAHLSPTGLFALKEATNIIGSEDTNVIGADGKLFMHAPLVVVGGMTLPKWDKGEKTVDLAAAFNGGGTTAVLGMDVAMVASRKVTEIHSFETVLVSADKVDVDGKTAVEIVVGSTGPGTQPHRIVVDDAGILIEVKQAGKQVKIDAPDSDIILNAENANVTMIAKEVTVAGSDKADIVTKNATIDATDNAVVKTKHARVESDSFDVDAQTVKLSGSTKIELAAGPSSLELSGSGATLRSTAAAGITLQAPNVEARS